MLPRRCSLVRQYRYARRGARRAADRVSGDLTVGPVFHVGDEVAADLAVAHRRRPHGGVAWARVAVPVLDVQRREPRYGDVHVAAAVAERAVRGHEDLHEATVGG